jgi:acetylglutamate synthase
MALPNSLWVNKYFICKISSSYYKIYALGNTSVLAAVYGPTQVKIKDELLDKAVVEVSFQPLIGTTGIICEYKFGDMY